MYQNRMRNIHLHIQSEYRKENVKIFWQWKKLENKMVDFQNHRKFSLRCLSKDNERMRLINNSITMFMYQRDTCIDQLKGIFVQETMEECEEFDNIKRESRHLKTLGMPEIKI